MDTVAVQIKEEATVAGVKFPSVAIPYFDADSTAGGPQALVPDEDLYPRLGDIDAMRLVYREFMRGGDLEKVAANHGVDRRTVFKWAARGKWLETKREVLSAEEEYERQKLSELRIKERLPELESQIKAGRKLREAVELHLERPEDLTPGQVMALGNALKAAGDNTVRALGVAESGSTESDTKVAASKNPPLVVVVKGGGLPPVRQSGPGGVEIIDV